MGYKNNQQQTNESDFLFYSTRIGITSIVIIITYSFQSLISLFRYAGAIFGPLIIIILPIAIYEKFQKENPGIPRKFPFILNLILLLYGILVTPLLIYDSHTKNHS